MTNRQAIRAINRQKSKINEYGDDLIWIEVTKEIFSKVFGKNSAQYQLIKSFRNMKPHERDLHGWAEWDSIIYRLAKVLDEAIETIKQDGISNPETKNFSSGLIILGFTISKRAFNVTVATSFLLGFILGAYNNPSNAINHMIKETFHLPISDSSETKMKSNN